MNMKFAFIAAAAALFAASAPLSAGGLRATPPETAEPLAQEGDTELSRSKGLLLELVRQDRYLDDAITALSAGRASLSAHDISALSLRLKAVRVSLDGAAEAGKAQFSEVHPGLELSPFTKAILSYSSKMDRKAGQLETLAARLGAQSAKETMRDSLSSAPGAAPKKRGKTITMLLAERKASETLLSDIKKLRRSSSKLTATSRWLYIISK